MAPDVKVLSAAAETPTDLQKLQLDYAWKWFAYHADQRLKMFNYMLLVFGIAAAGVVNALSKADQIPTWAICGLCVVTALLAVLFTFLDRRNRDLVWFGEDVLIYLERSLLFGVDLSVNGRKDRVVPFGVLWRQERDNRRIPSDQPGNLVENTSWVSMAYNTLEDAFLGKHRVVLPLIGYLLALTFLLAACVIAFTTVRPALSEKAPLYRKSPTTFGLSDIWV